MKRILLSLAMTLASTAKAAPATAYNCVGHNKINGESVMFEVLFAEHAPEAGYTNQLITIVKRGWEQLDQPLTFQMYGATKRNNCKLNSVGETYMHGGLEMDFVSSENPAYTVKFKTNCGRETAMDVTGYCYHQ